MKRSKNANGAGAVLAAAVEDGEMGSMVEGSEGAGGGAEAAEGMQKRSKNAWRMFNSEVA